MEDWDIEEFRTKFESDEHWILKRDFMTAHKDKFPKDRVVCLAQLFVNIELLRCKYPDPVMRQVAELSKGIGKDYKTKQKERLQRTFVKASDAANAKVRGVKRRQSPVQQGGHSKISFVQATSSASSTGIGAEPANSGSTSVASKISFIRETCEKTAEKADMISDSTFSQPNKYMKALKREDRHERVSVISPKIAAIRNAVKTPILPPEKSDESLDINLNDPYAANLFVVYRSFLNFSSFFNFLKCSVEFSHLMLKETYYTETKTKEWICTLTVMVRGDTLSLGSGTDFNQKKSREEASKQALQKLFQKCYTIEIKKRVAGNEEITLGKLVGVPEQEKKIANDNMGAKLLKLMGWTGGALGKSGEGITEPVKASNVFGRQGLGIRDEQRPTPNFQRKIQNVLDTMIASLQSQPDGVVPDTIFSSELSSEQRKYIHLFVRRKYPQLKSVSYGKDADRYLVVKPKLDSLSLFEKVNQQGGLTDQYQIHKPGTLTLDKISA